jgi:hypothetical protein
MSKKIVQKGFEDAGYTVQVFLLNAAVNGSASEGENGCSLLVVKEMI